MGRNISHKKRGRRWWRSEKISGRERESGVKGGVKRRVCKRKNEDKGEGEREKDMELEQQNNYRQ